MQVRPSMKSINKIILINKFEEIVEIKM